MTSKRLRVEAFPCKECGDRTYTYNTRPANTADGSQSVWRRRKCLSCGYRCTTVERFDYDSLPFNGQRRPRAASPYFEFCF